MVCKTDTGKAVMTANACMIANACFARLWREGLLGEAQQDDVKWILCRTFAN